jgi:phage portal protein BeeE
MENFTWLLVSRMFIPLVEPVQPHNWEVFEWSPEFWARMGPQTKGKTTHQTHPAQPVDHAKQLTATEQARHDADAIGVFEL